MAAHQIKFTDVDNPDAPSNLPVLPGSTYIYTWDTQTAISWAGSFNAYGPINSGLAAIVGVIADVGSVTTGSTVITDPTKTILIELQRNGTTVQSKEWDNSDALTLAPRTVLTYIGPASVGDTWQVQITVSAMSIASVDVDDGSQERGGFFPPQSLSAAETYAAPITELCDELYVTEPGELTIPSYVSSTQAPLATWSTIGQAWALSFDGSHNAYVAESEIADSYGGWSADNTFCIGTRILASDGNVYRVTAAVDMSGCDTSGGTEPSWPGGGTVTDGNLTWTFERAGITTTKNLIEKFDHTGTSLGQITDMQAQGVADTSPMGIRVGPDGNLYVIGYLNSGQLELFKITTSGAVLATYDIAYDGFAGTILDVDVDTNGLVYYIEEQIADGSGSTYLRCYDPATGQKPPALTFPVLIDTNHSDHHVPQYLGAFRLLLESGQGGAVVAKTPDTIQPVFQTVLDFFDENKTLINEVGVGNPPGTVGDTLPIQALCFGEDSETFWYGDGTNAPYVLTKIGTAPATLNPGDFHNDIASCYTEHGDGFLFPTGGAFVFIGWIGG